MIISQAQAKNQHGHSVLEWGTWPQTADWYLDNGMVEEAKLLRQRSWNHLTLPDFVELLPGLEHASRSALGLHSWIDWLAPPLEDSPLTMGRAILALSASDFLETEEGYRAVQNQDFRVPRTQFLELWLNRGSLGRLEDWPLTMRRLTAREWQLAFQQAIVANRWRGLLTYELRRNHDRLLRWYALSWFQLLPELSWDWRVYVLECRDQSYYCGVTTDLPRRILQHQTGKGSKYVRSRLPFVLRGLSLPMSKSAALSLEKRFKLLGRDGKQRALDAPFGPFMTAPNIVENYGP